MDYYSPTLTADFFEKQRASSEKYPHSFQQKLIKALNKCIEIINQCATPDLNYPHLIEPPQKEFKLHEEALNELLVDYLESNLVIEMDDLILKLCNYWMDFTAALEFINKNNKAFFTSFNPLYNTIKITCCDASTLLLEHYNHFEQIIGFSATLKPFSYYSQLIGLNSPLLHTQEFSTPFLKDRRKLLIIPQISSKYRERSQHYPKIIEAVSRITALHPGNYFIFFPSFDFLEQVFSLFTPSPAFKLIRQYRNMQSTEIKDLLNKLHRKDRNYLFFAVQGGMFAEGIDYIGDLVIGAFIVGPPLPVFDWEREQMKKYYHERFGEGNEYAYIYPAMAKSIQAAGRVIRSETDKGLIVLLDNRFLLPDYSQCMPNDWFLESPQELISNSILNDIQLFWDKIEL